MNRQSLLTFGLFISFILPVIAQEDYAITPKGDTLKGKLVISMIDNLDRLQITEKGKKKTYTAIQIKTFHKGSSDYRPVKHDNAIKFMKVVRSGYLSLFAYNTTWENSWDGLYLEKRDGTGMDIPNISFKKILSKYLDECPVLMNQINQGELAKQDIERIVEIYNACIQAKTEVGRKQKEDIVLNNKKIEALTSFAKKVEAENFLTKKDVLDILGDIQGKVSKNQSVPHYLVEGLRSYLIDTPQLLKEADEFLPLLEK